MRNRLGNGIDVFGPGTDLVITLFAVMAVLYSFAAASSFEFEKTAAANAQRADEAERESTEKGDSLRIANENLQDSKDKLDETTKRHARDAEAEKQLRQELLGLKGDLTNVVFVVDCSGSMSDDGKWTQTSKLIQNWIRYLPVKNAALVIFSSSTEVYPRNGTFLDMSQAANRDMLARRLESKVPDGGTNTRSAVRTAYGYDDLTTMFLFTDGRPTQDGVSSQQQTAAELVDSIISDVKQFRRRRRKLASINTVALGDYFSLNGQQEEDLPTIRLLKTLAELTGGSYRAR